MRFSAVCILTRALHRTSPHGTPVDRSTPSVSVTEETWTESHGDTKVPRAQLQLKMLIRVAVSEVVNQGIVLVKVRSNPITLKIDQQFPIELIPHLSTSHSLNVHQLCTEKNIYAS